MNKGRKAYRAKDEKLGPEVDSTVMPEESAKDQDRSARFGRDAGRLAALNHPNITLICGS